MLTHKTISRATKRAIAIFVIHCCVFVAAYWLAYVIRFPGAIPNQWQIGFRQTWLGVCVVKLIVFYALGHGRFSWRHARFSDLVALLRAATLSTLVIATIDLMWDRYLIPRWILALDWALTILILGGLRALWRLSREEFQAFFIRKDGRRALIVGASLSGEALAQQCQSNQRLNYLPVGFLDDDTSRHGSRLAGIKILGNAEDAIYFARLVSAQDILVISDVLTGERLRRLMERCKEEQLNLKIIPAINDLLTSDFVVNIRDININDLLRREPVELSNESIRDLISGQTVMVTGAGGSIGSEICRQVLKFSPQQLLLVERAENSLFEVEQEFAALERNTLITPCVADVCDPNRMEQLFSDHRPHVVFHAAAHKHVPMMEHNPGEAIKNNVAGTAQLAELADRYETDEFVLISTDKSVNPTSVMGVSKQLAERFVHAISEESATKFVVVRFGNVLGSAGSVVPIFQKQIRQGGPITVTHPEIERFFMTIPEASQLVLQAAAMGKGGEIFVLDMGKPVRIVDLANDLIRLSGFTPEEIPITFTGLRPGEKLYEELYFEDEEMMKTPHPKLFVAYHRSYPLGEVREMIAELAQHVDDSPEKLRELILRLVPEYDPNPLRNASCQGQQPAEDSSDPEIAPSHRSQP